MCSPIRRGSILPNSATTSFKSKNSGLEHLHSAEGQQLPGHGNGAVAGFLNLFEAAPLGGFHAGAIEKKVAVAANDGEQIVEVVRHSAGQPADSFHFVGLAKALFELFVLALRFLEAAAHAVEGRGYFGDFVTAGALESKTEIALFESANTANQICQRARESIGDKENQRAAREDADKPESKKNAVQAAQEGGGSVE